MTPTASGYRVGDTVARRVGGAEADTEQRIPVRGWVVHIYDAPPDARVAGQVCTVRFVGGAKVDFYSGYLDKAPFAPITAGGATYRRPDVAERAAIELCSQLLTLRQDGWTYPRSEGGLTTTLSPVIEGLRNRAAELMEALAEWAQCPLSALHAAVSAAAAEDARKHCNTQLLLRFPVPISSAEVITPIHARKLLIANIVKSSRIPPTDTEVAERKRLVDSLCKYYRITPVQLATLISPLCEEYSPPAIAHRGPAALAAAADFPALPAAPPLPSGLVPRYDRDSLNARPPHAAHQHSGRVR